MVKLFDISNGKVIPTEHCFTNRTLRRIMETYPDDFLTVYQYLFYMTCPNPDLNIYFHVKDNEKEEMILDELAPINFSTEDDEVQFGLEFCRKIYETETARAYNGIKIMLDNMADYMASAKMRDGKDGNIIQLVSAAKNFDAIRQSYKGTLKDLQEEQSTTVRGGKNLAYDQM
jgi:hypothetical protein